jgi:TPR repeat protein
MTLRSPWLFVLAVGIAAQLDANAGLAEGMDAMERKDWAPAMRELRPVAEQGNAQAQLYVGLMTHEGHGVAPDPVAAVVWYRRAAEGGRADAQHILAAAMVRGDGTARDPSEAYFWFSRSADQGHERSKAVVASIDAGFERGMALRADGSDVQEAERLLRIAVASGHPGAILDSWKGRPSEECPLPSRPDPEASQQLSTADSLSLLARTAAAFEESARCDVRQWTAAVTATIDGYVASRRNIDAAQARAQAEEIRAEALRNVGLSESAHEDFYAKLVSDDRVLGRYLLALYTFSADQARVADGLRADRLRAEAALRELETLR